MRCSRCGEECKENQVFCLKCGNPIHAVPNMEKVEEELANNVEKIINNDNEDDDFEYIDLMPRGEIETELTLTELEEIKNSKKKTSGNQFKKSLEDDGFQVNADDVEREYEKNKKVFSDIEDDMEEDYDDEEEYLEGELKKKAVILGLIGAVIVGIILFVAFAVNSKEKGNDGFETAYDKGSDYYTSKDYDNAITQYELARTLATTDSEKIKADNALLAIYEKREGTEDKQIEILKELVELSPDEYENYEKLVNIYDSKGMTAEITDFIDGIQSQSIKANLMEFIATVPKFSENSGVYDHYISVKIISAYDQVYYTLDGTDPTVASTPYTSEIRISNSGQTTIKAISVNEKGIVSKIGSATYDIQLNYVEPPVINPSGGDYTENTEITVEVPEGMKCYYTYGESFEEPTTASTEYTGPVKMLRGKNIFSAILQNESGKVSESAQVIYRLTIEASVGYEDALVIIGNYIEDNEIAVKVEDEQYVMDDGHIIYLTYDSIAQIGDEDYYVINAIEKNESEYVEDSTYYGVDTVTGDLVILEKDSTDSEQYKVVDNNVEEEETTE